MTQMLSPDVHDRSTAGDSGQKRAETATVDYDLPLDRSDLVKASLPSGLFRTKRAYPRLGSANGRSWLCVDILIAAHQIRLAPNCGRRGHPRRTSGMDPGCAKNPADPDVGVNLSNFPKVRFSKSLI